MGLRMRQSPAQLARTATLARCNASASATVHLHRTLLTAKAAQHCPQHQLWPQQHALQQRCAAAGHFTRTAVCLARLAVANKHCGELQ